MAGRGAPPKPAHLRQRRNKDHATAQLPTEEAALENEVPELPARDGGWHAKVVEWWESAWRSPMASEWLDSDMRGGLYQLARLQQAIWTTEDTADLVKLSTEIRLCEQRYGMTPVDRSRLRWVIAAGDEAAEKTEKRRARKSPKKGSKGKDPRDVLKMVG